MTSVRSGERQLVAPDGPLDHLVFPGRALDVELTGTDCRLGGYSRVEVGRDPVMGQVAVKTLTFRDDGSTKHMQELRQELIPRSIPGHPNIGWVWRVGVTPEGERYSVQEFYRNTYSDFRRMAGISRLGHVLDIAVQLCDGVQHLENHGVVNGDITPANVVFDEVFRPRLIDWGLAVVVGNSGVAEARGCTPMYAAPEVFSSGRVTLSTDLYSLGATLWSFIWGAPPWPELSWPALQLKKSSPPSIPTHRGNEPVPNQIRAALSAALAPSPADRPQSAEDLKRELLPFAQHPNCCFPLPPARTGARVGRPALPDDQS